MLPDATLFDTASLDERLAEFERLIHRDPARRGLISAETSSNPKRIPLCPGHLAKAAKHITANGRRAIIVTGFFIPGASPPAAETDGPPGAALLAAALTHIGMSVQIVTDEPCRSAVEVAAREMGLPSDIVSSIPIDEAQQADWCAKLINPERSTSQPPLTHLISIERVGPSHTIESISNQRCRLGHPDIDELQKFNQLVPEQARDHCHNMRGECIDEQTAPLHRLFELAADHPAICTIGIGDGGNEIGMGAISWSELFLRLNSPGAARIPCRIATDWTILAGVSNWGGQALAMAVLLLKGATDAARDWTATQQQILLERLVREGPAVDGVTRLSEPTVDGLPFLTYIQPWEGLRRLTRQPE